MTLSASLIFLNWNGRDYLSQCLPSAFALDYEEEYEVIVVDNGSSDNSVEFVRRQFPQAGVIENGRNLGFAGGMNVGLRAARGEVGIILNNDVILRPGWLTELLAPMAADPRIGIAGCKIFYPDGKTLQHAGGIIRSPRMVPEHFGYREVDEGEYDELRDVDYVTAAAMALRLDMLEQIGYLDVGFFPIYYEDTEICYRARDAGYRVVYVPRATMIHLESATMVYASTRYVLNMHRGRLRFAMIRLDPSELVQSFVPAEAAWLKEKAAPQERLVMPRVYLASMLAYPGLYLKHWAGCGDGRADALEAVLGAIAGLRDQVWNG
jgi:GT2 family glycosyltransferase